MPSSDPHEHGDHDDHDHDDHDQDDHDHDHDHDHGTQHATSSELSAAAVTGLPLLDYDAAAAQLTRSNLKWEDGNAGNGSGVGASGTVTYGYLLQSGNLNNPALNADEIANFELIVSMIEDIADIEFTRVTDAGSDYIVSASSVQIDIRGIAGTNGGVTNYSYSGSTLISASVATGTHKLDTIGDFAFATAIHELAHALGVLHPGDYDGSVTEDDKAYYQDSQQYSLMSYFSEADSGADFGNGYFYENGGFVEGSRAPSAPMLHDIAALQRLYGANTTTRTGDSTYGWNSNLGHGVWSVTDYKQIPMGAIWDQGGVDTIDASGYLSDSVIDLREEGFSSFGTYEAGGYGPPFNNEAIVHNVAIARGVKIENAVGGVGDDLLIGNAADASHSDADGTGYSGNNTLDGGGGTNTVSYAAGVEGIDIDLSLGGAGAGGHVYALGENGNDRLINIQNLIGSAFADTLGAAAGGSVLEGGAGDDILTGGAGNDTLDGGAGSDLVDYGDASGGLTIDLSLGGGDAGGHAYALAGEGTDTLRNIEGLIGSGFADDLTLGAAGGTLRGGAGNDSLTGGSGSDTADYSDATAALAIDLTLGGATAGGHTYALGSRGNDTLRNIDNLIGGAFDDVLTLASTGGTLEGGAGADSLIGGNGTDTASYANAAAGVSLDILSPGGFTGDAAGDVFVSIEGILGSAHADTLRGHSGVDILSGGSGVDTLIGRGSLDSLLGGEGNDVLLGGGGTDVLHGGAGADFMRGDAGIDRVLYVTAAEAVRVDLSDMALNTGEAEGDNIQLVENIDGSDHHDDLRGDTGDNYLRGRDGNDTLRGRGGDDTLEGGRGADVLLGQGGADHFRFTGPNQGVDTINDFEIGIDSIDVLGSAFGGLPTGTLAAGRFVVGTSAGDADDRFIYNDSNGRLFYDADGSGGGAAKLLTVLAGAPPISASDIEVV